MTQVMRLGFDLSGSSAIEARRMSANGMDRLARLAIRQNYPMRQGFAKSSVGFFPFFAGEGVIIQRISVLRDEECVSVDYRILAGGGFPEDIYKSNSLIILHPGEGVCEIARDISCETWQLSLAKEVIWVPIPAGFPFALRAIESFRCTILYGIR